MSEITIQEFKKYKARPTGLVYMENLLLARQIDFVREFKFCPDRRFRSDIHFSVPNQFEGNYLVEYEGLPLGGAKSGHVTITGYTNNCEKYNLATLMGFKVLRYTALNYKQFEKDLEKICNLVKK